MMEEENMDIQIEDTLEFEDQDSAEEFPVNHEFRGEMDPQEGQDDPTANVGHDHPDAIPSEPGSNQHEENVPQNTYHTQSPSGMEQQKTPSDPTRVMRFEDFIRDRT